MKHLHANSLCCVSKVIRFGRRRRQCISCLKTWRIRPKRRGRKRKREGVDLAIRYLTHTIPPVSTLARALGRPVSTAKCRLARSLAVFLRRTAWPAVPATVQLIAVADAWTKKPRERYHTWYGIFLRPASSNQATIMPLTHLPGRESTAGWQAAFAKLPKDVLEQIAALVADGHLGLVNEAKRRNWLLQRCHFHLIAAIQGRRSRWHAGRHRREGEYLFRLVSKILSTTDRAGLTKLIDELEVISWQTKSTQLRRVLSGFISHVDDYHTYLKHPELHLPRTSNTAEAFFSLMERLCQRARGFSGIASLDRWITAAVKHRRVITCNGSTNQIS